MYELEYYESNKVENREGELSLRAFFMYSFVFKVSENSITGMLNKTNVIEMKLFNVRDKGELFCIM